MPAPKSKRKWLKRALVAGGITATAAMPYFGARVVEKTGPKLAKPAAAKVVQAYRITASEAKEQVNGLIKGVGWRIFWAGIGAAGGAYASMGALGSTRKSTRKMGQGKTTSEHTTYPTAGKKTRAAIIGASALGGAIIPPAGITAGGVRLAYNTWRTMTPEQRKRAGNFMRRIFKRSRRRP